MICKKIAEIIEKSKYSVLRVSDMPERCIVDFTHPTVKPEDAGFISGVHYNKTENKLEVTARRKVKGFKELFLDYCCENGANMCRPHVWMDEKGLSIEAKFSKEPLEKLKRLLNDLF